ncbi:hypothetical protein [Methylobacterium sp. WL1]|uniref:hypothetical protein n=1 Tax=Methylobacterium sp. WL1 TaxID=2603276 RepID=UPI001FEF6BA8|nr:hypothetical protein [Methylobacterium sp. WL1]
MTRAAPARGAGCARTGWRRPPRGPPRPRPCARRGARSGALDAEPAQVAPERVGIGRDQRHGTGEAQRRRLDLAADGQGRVAGSGRGQAAQQQASRALDGAGERKVRPFLAAQHRAAHRQVEVEHGRQPGPGARQPAADQVLALRGGQEGVEVEPAGLQGQAGAPLAQVEPSGAAQAQRPAARIDRQLDALEPDLGAPGLEAAPERERQVGAGRLGRRADHQAGRAFGLDDRPVGLGGDEAQPGVGLEAGMRVAAAGDLHGEPPVRPGRPAHRPERDAAARALDPPRPDQRGGLQAQVLDVELVGPAGGRHLGGHQELLDVQVLDGEVAGAQGLAEIGRDPQGLAGHHRELDLGPSDSRLGEAELALQQWRQGDLGLDEAGVEGRAGRIGPEMQAVDPQPRRGQEPDLDPAVGPGRHPEGPGQAPVDERALGLPIDDGRNGQSRDENQDDGARQRGQKITHATRSALFSARAGTIAMPRRRVPPWATCHRP